MSENYSMGNSFGSNSSAGGFGGNSNISDTSTNASRVKTTLLIDKTLKKLAQMYALQNDITLQELVEKALRRELEVSGK